MVTTPVVSRSDAPRVSCLSCFDALLGALSARAKAPKPTPPTCAANVIGRIPILKHVLGVFGLVAASSSSITKTLRKTSIVLYVGGIAVSSRDVSLFCVWCLWASIGSSGVALDQCRLGYVAIGWTNMRGFGSGIRSRMKS